MVRRFSEDMHWPVDESEAGDYVLHSDFAALQASHDRLLREMTRFATVIERANGEPLLWIRLTDGTGIATPNAYRQAIAAAQPFTEK